MKKLNEKGKKNSKFIQLNTALDIVERFGESNGLKKHEKFFMLHTLGIPTVEAATALGYKPNYGYDLVYQLKNNSKWRHRVSQIIESLPDVYKSICKVQLLNIAEVERKALEKYAEDPELAINKPQLLKHMKQTAGVIGDDFGPTPPQIPISQIQILIQQGMGGNGDPSRDKDQNSIKALEYVKG